MRFDASRLDALVSRRAQARQAQRRAASLSNSILEALGAKSKLWFSYEEAREALGIAREAAAFDAGVEDGLTAAIAHKRVKSRAVRQLAERLTQEALSSGLSKDDCASALALAAWSLLHAGRSARRR